MGSLPIRGPRDLDTHLNNSVQIIERLRSQTQLDKIDSKFLLQRLTTVKEALEKVIEERKSTVDNERLARVYRVSRLIASLDLQTVLEQVMDGIVQLTGAERGFLMMLDDGQLEI